MRINEYRPVTRGGGGSYEPPDTIIRHQVQKCMENMRQDASKCIILKGNFQFGGTAPPPQTSPLPTLAADEPATVWLWAWSIRQKAD